MSFSGHVLCWREGSSFKSHTLNEPSFEIIPAVLFRLQYISEWGDYLVYYCIFGSSLWCFLWNEVDRNLTGFHSRVVGLVLLRLESLHSLSRSWTHEEVVEKEGATPSELNTRRKSCLSIRGKKTRKQSAKQEDERRTSDHEMCCSNSCSPSSLVLLWPRIVTPTLLP